uniref:(northern house mosquito) hypothetical protein n=1 Tax=Culex pipiens TaxID=7175 RepID=A0A8D8PFY7_CULPI
MGPTGCTRRHCSGTICPTWTIRANRCSPIPNYFPHCGALFQRRRAATIPSLPWPIVLPSCVTSLPTLRYSGWAATKPRTILRPKVNCSNNITTTIIISNSSNHSTSRNLWPVPEPVTDIPPGWSA